MKTTGDLLHEQVIRLIEPLTRFDRSSLVRAAEQTSVAEGTASWWYFVHLEVEGKSGGGSLPSGVRAHSSAGAARQAAEAAKSSAHAALEARLQRWSEENADDDSGLSASDCLDGSLDFGHAHSCGDCNGAGKNRCRACGGQGRSQCTGCGGRGSSTCGACSGSGTDRCGACGGMGSKQEYVTKAVWDGYNNRYVSQSQTETRNCAMCMGSGRRTCSGCNGSRTKTCYSCGGQGQVNCGPCSATGSVSCSSCAATGTKHQRWRLSCRITNRFEVKLQHANAEVMARLSSSSLDGLRRVAIVRQVEPKVFDDVVGRKYTFTCHICEMVIEAGEKGVTLAGYGGSATVYNFKNIVGLLLEGDLAALQQALERTSKFSLRPQAPLVDALRECLLSEANAQLGEGGEEAQRLKSMGGLSEDYATRLTEALRKAFRRLYFGEIALGAIIAALIPVLSGMTAIRLGFTTGRSLTAVVLPWVAGVAVYALMEFMARKRINDGFGEVFGKKRIDAILRGQKVLKRWRIATALMALLPFAPIGKNL